MTGRVFKGPLFDAYNRLTYPSIPTNTEQILYQVPKNKAFGSSEHRFNYHSSQVLPGPGKYLNRTMDASSSSNPSISKKGYSGLAKKEGRFKMFRFNTPVPGPGNYTIKSNWNTSTFSYKKSTSHSKQNQSSFLSKDKDTSPGPSEYSPRNLGAWRRGMTSTFKSKSKKGLDFRNENPAPGQYSLDRSLKDNGPVIRDSVRAKRVLYNLYDPHSDYPLQYSPGPGYYNVDYDRLAPHTLSPVFNLNNTDRFGVSVFRKSEKEELGPGKYHSKEKKVLKSEAKSAVFKSETERRWILPDRKPPGPAFYKPNVVPKKKSFRYNFNKIWH